MKSIIFLSAILFLSASCGSKKKTEITESTANTNSVTLTADQLKNAGIVTGKIDHRNITTTLKLSGKIDVPPQNMLAVSVPLGGYLKSTKLLPGMRVRRGEVIAAVEGQQYIQLQEDYLTAKARVRYLESEYERQRDLNQNKASSDKVFQRAEADFRSQQALITSLSEKLRLAGINPGNISSGRISREVNIYSPINGFVSKVNVNVGKYVSPTDVLFELVNPADIHLALNVYEKDLSQLFVGQKLIAYNNSEPLKKYNGSISLIGPDLSQDGRADVHCHLEIYDKTLVPGTFMNAEVQVGSNMSNVVPTDAVVSYEGKQYVFVKKGPDTFEMVEVSSGETQGGYTAVDFTNSSVAGDQQYVFSGAYSLLMMMKNRQ